MRSRIRVALIQVIHLIAKIPTMAAFAYRHNRACRTSIRRRLSSPATPSAMIYKMIALRYQSTGSRMVDVLFILHADHGEL